tara:strand:- start:18981 stop:19973 length:993 start_codon:yes stop_codon:yes gene_type:complete
MIKASITATARFLPEKVVTNYDLEKMMDTSHDWIVTRTGIEERRICSEDETTSVMCTHVANELLEKSGLNADEVDAIIVGTVTPDMLFPSTAAIIQNEIGAKHAWGFDLSAACSGFLFALDTGARLLESGKYKNVIILGADKMSSIINYNDRETSVLFGDGAGGVLVSPNQNDEGFIDSILFIDGGGGDLLKMPGGGSLNPATVETIEKNMHYVQQDGKKVFKSAVKGMSDVVKKLLLKNQLSSEDIKLFIPHQANKRIIDACRENLNLSEDQVFINIQKYANTTAGTIPICISEAADSNLLQAGDYLVLASFGAGFTWGSILLKWGNAT